jgi:hypothetical protein
LTLAAGYLGWVVLPGRWVEAAIAASIVWVAAENLLREPTARRWTAAFAFGLLHGFGFAGFLQELSLSGSGLVLPLLSFNVGVELGQLAIVVMVYPIIRWSSAQPWHRRRMVYPVSVCAGLAGGYWLVERVFLS